MTLDFPNASRSYDARRNLVRFWGYDTAIEISFFVEAGAFCKLDPETDGMEAACLAAFDDARERVHAAARKAYAQGRKDAYLLAAADV